MDSAVAHVGIITDPGRFDCPCQRDVPICGANMNLELPLLTFFHRGQVSIGEEGACTFHHAVTGLALTVVNPHACVVYAVHTMNSNTCRGVVDIKYDWAFVHRIRFRSTPFNRSTPCHRATTVFDST